MWRFDSDGDAVWLRYEVGDGAGEARVVTEWPERREGDGELGLERRFRVSAGTREIALSVEAGAGRVEAEHWEGPSSRIPLPSGDS